MAINSQMQTTTAGAQAARSDAAGNQTTPTAESSQTTDASGGSAVAVDLSPAAQVIAGLLPGQSGGNADLDGFMQILQQQIHSQGTDAAVLGELPQDASADRVQLAKQAANHLLVSYYHDDSRYADASTQDPFANLDSDSLTRIASNDSGTFTSAERQLAYFEGAQRGTDGANVAFSALSPQAQGAASWNWAPAATEDACILGTLNPGAPGWQSGQLNTQLIDGLSAGGVATAAAQETAALSTPTFGVTTGADGAPQWTTQPADGQDPGASTALDGSILTQMTGATAAPSLSLYRQIAAYGG
ncbi:hypothetical protein [Pseudomonas sp. SORGH_AS_0211]|uniref:hypothetical protein n=1 Tax=Pseudomonas sp. SORGH_AS_0211 TaxID=3041796 RepID=UPI00286C57BB|nr:hypothetical protein [Pseudomonas sp. SORGH_AS_0211]